MANLFDRAADRRHGADNLRRVVLIRADRVIGWWIGVHGSWVPWWAVVTRRRYVRSGNDDPR